MAMIPRNYAFVGTNDAELASYVGPPSQVDITSVVPLPTLTIAVEDTVPGLLETLDAFLATKGFVRV